MIYVTSDLHGYPLEGFLALLQKAQFGPEDYLFVLGDVIDRGRQGVELLRWMADQPNVQLILGNHEMMLLSVSDWLLSEVTEESLVEPEKIELLNDWYANGAAPTIAGLRKLRAEAPDVLDGVLDYLRDAPFYDVVEAGGTEYVLLHAGIENFEPDRPLDTYDPDELLWTRPDLHTEYYDHAVVVFGHTPTGYFGTQYREKAVKTKSWICIDTGAAMGGKPMLLRLDDGAEFYG